jgi:tetratricopeptide (TPR) repeat protein
LGIAQKALRLGDSAKSSFARAIELRPGMTEADAALTGLSVQNGESDNALRRADHAVSSNPASALGYVARAQALLERGDLRQGEAMLESALHQDPASLPALAIMVKLYGKQGRTKEALQRLSGLAATRPNEAGLPLLMAVCYFDLKDVDKAESSAKRAMVLDPKTSEAYAMLANVDFARGSAEKAKAHLRTAIETNPHNVSNYLALESSYKREGNWEEAKKLCERAHQMDAGSPQVAMELAFLYLEHGGDVNIALSLAQMVNQKIPDFPAAADLLGWAYYKLGSANSAIPHLEECVRKVPDQSVYQYHLGMAYMAAGRSKPAEQYLRRALEIDPSLAYASSAKAALDQISKFSR